MRNLGSANGEEIGALFKSSIKRDERYPTKLKARAGRPTIVAHTTLDGDVSSGQGAEYLTDLVKTHYGLQGMRVTGNLSATMWATRKACGVHFHFSSLNLSRCTERPATGNDELGELMQMICGSTAGA